MIMPLVLGVVIPMIVAAAIFAPASLKPDLRATLLRWSPAAGILAAYIALKGLPEWPFSEASQWLFLFLPAAALLAQFTPQNRWAQLGLSFVLLATGFGFMFQSMIEYYWESVLVSAFWLSGLALFALAVQSAFAANRTTSLFAQLHPIAVLSGAALLSAMSGSLFLAQLAGALAAAIGATVLVAKFKLDLSSVAPVIAVVLTAITAMGNFYADLSWISVIAILGAAVTPAVIARLRVRKAQLPAQIASSAALLITGIITAALNAGF